MPIVDIKGVGEVEFPDSMSPDEIKQAIHSSILPKYSSGRPPPPGLMDNIANSTIGQGIIGAGDSVQNLAASLANLIPGVKVPLSRAGEGTAYNVGKIGGDIGTFLGGGEALDAGRLASRGIPAIGRLAESLSGGGFRGVARRGLGSAAYGGVTNPEDRAQGSGIQGLTSIASDALLGGLGKLKPSNLFRGNLSLEELARNLKITEGTETGLGQVIESPLLNTQHENVITKIPFSGAYEAMGRNAKQIIDKGNKLLNKYLGGTHPDLVDSEIAKSLIKAKREQDYIKNQLYSDVHKIAKSSGLTLNLKNFSNNAEEYFDLIKDQAFLKYEPSAKKLIKRLQNYTNEPGVSLEEANILAGKLNSLSKMHGASPNSDDRYMSKILGKLGSSLKQDIKNSIQRSGNTDLKKSYSKAEQNYENIYSPFLDKEIYKFTEGGKDPESIVSTFIKTGKNTDKSNQLKKLMDKLDPKTQDLVKYSYFSRAIKGAEGKENVDPSTLKSLWGKGNLGSKQKKALISDIEERKSLDDYTKLSSMNKESLERMLNHSTGKRALDLIPSILLGHAIGGVGGYEEGGVPGAIAGGLAGIAAPALAGKAATHLLTSPSIREKLVNRMISPKPRGKTSNLAKALAQTLVNSNTQGNQ